MAAPVGDTAWLEWMTGLMGAASRQRHTAKLPPHQFHCLLDELPLHLIPQGSAPKGRVCGPGTGDDAAQELLLNPECLILSAGEIPEPLEAHRQLLGGFCLDGTLAWVRDAAVDAMHPFWLGPRLADAVSRLHAGESAFSLPQDLRLLLTQAGILTQPDHARRRAAEWSETVRLRALAFRERNFVPLRNLIHPFHLAALRRYYRYAIRRGAIRLGDEQSPRRYVAHNEPVARYFHHQIAKAVSAIVEEPVKPSYVYLASYLSGAELKKHTDREQCEFSVTLCLDFSPEPDLATSWPLCLNTPEGEVTVYQALGDGLLYRGTKLPHYRAALGEGYSSTSIFFHYVRWDFPGSLD